MDSPGPRPSSPHSWVDLCHFNVEPIYQSYLCDPWILYLLSSSDLFLHLLLAVHPHGLCKTTSEINSSEITNYGTYSTAPLCPSFLQTLLHWPSSLLPSLMFSLCHCLASMPLSRAAVSLVSTLCLLLLLHWISLFYICIHMYMFFLCLYICMELIPRFNLVFFFKISSRKCWNRNSIITTSVRRSSKGNRAESSTSLNLFCNFVLETVVV